MIFLKLCQCLNFAFSMLHMSHMTQHGCAQVCIGVRECVRVWWVCSYVCAQLCVRNEFSEYLLETRFLTSGNYSTHPLRILLTKYWLPWAVSRTFIHTFKSAINSSAHFEPFWIMIESVESTEKLREKFRLSREFSTNHDRDSAFFLLTKTTKMAMLYLRPVPCNHWIVKLLSSL